jgi:hypothetical protein
VAPGELTGVENEQNGVTSTHRTVSGRKCSRIRRRRSENVDFPQKLDKPLAIGHIMDMNVSNSSCLVIVYWFIILPFNDLGWT